MRARMQHAVLELLLPILFAATPTRTATADAPRTVELDIVEKPKGGKRSEIHFLLLVNGKAEVDVADDPHRRTCKVESQYDRDHGESWIRLDCGELELELRPKVAVGKRTVLAKIERPDGGTVEVGATWK
jgi:hypothetical protein